MCWSAKPGIFSLFFVLSSVIVVNAKHLQSSFDKSRYYSVMASGSLEELNEQLSMLSASALTDRDAYEGALLMRKAGLTTTLKERMNYFQSGRTKLESSIKRETGNIEYRFLRLMIQENAPAILNYQNDLETDKTIIKKNFTRLPAVVQQAIRDYSRHSKILLPKDF